VPSTAPGQDRTPRDRTTQAAPAGPEIAQSPALQTVAFGATEAGVAALAVLFLGAVWFFFLLFRRRSRRAQDAR
jgi:cbb3-type cytochrome oxidase subunit 3